jgi:hypothetical protein
VDGVKRLNKGSVGNVSVVFAGKNWSMSKMTKLEMLKVSVTSIPWIPFPDGD